jgi:hypothetical protein
MPKLAAAASANRIDAVRDNEPHIAGIKRGNASVHSLEMLHRAGRSQHSHLQWVMGVGQAGDCTYRVLQIREHAEKD